MIVSKYNITVKEEAQFANETFAERKARILSARAGLSLTYAITFVMPDTISDLPHQTC